MSKLIFESVEKRRVRPKTAYKRMFNTKNDKIKRAHFIKMSIKVNESRGVSIFLSILFFMPWPIFLIKFFSRLSTKGMSKEEKETFKQTLKCLGYKPFVVQVVNEEVKLKIRTI